MGTRQGSGSVPIPLPSVFVRELYFGSQLEEEWGRCREKIWEVTQSVLEQWKETGWCDGEGKGSLGRQLITLLSFHRTVLLPTAWGKLKLKDNIGISADGHVFLNKLRLPLRCRISCESPGVSYLHPAPLCSAKTVCSHISSDMLEEQGRDDHAFQSQGVLTSLALLIFLKKFYIVGVNHFSESYYQKQFQVQDAKEN